MIGELLGLYRLDRELGSGGMGRVYAATGPAGVVALKVIHPHLVADGDALARFHREARVGASIRHPNVVATLEAGETGGRPWLALEYVEGQTLSSVLTELGTVPEELCRHVAHEVASGLAAIHEAGIVHRDLKPDNVLITRDHVVKVMDLGVARDTGDAVRLTQTNAFVGSLQYAAPEQFTGGGDGLDGRADLHALGVMLYELSTGANPYEDTDWRVVLQRVLKEMPRRLGSVNPQVSPFFEELVHTLLAKDRDDRFASASALVEVVRLGEQSPWWAARSQSIRNATKRPLRRVKIPRETALIGRDPEITRLRVAFDRVKAGDGQVVLVEGEAGIGKSRLVDEFVALLQREGEDLDFLYGSYPPGGAATASGAFATAYREHFGGEGLAETLSGYLKETPLLVPGFAALLSNQAPPDGALALTKDSLQTCFVHATRTIAAERLVVVLIDDLHFAPDEGRALFASLAMAVPGHRILLVGTSRPPIDEKWAANVGRLGHMTRIAVGRLGPKDLAALLRDALKSSRLAEELSFKIAEKSDGNPFFVFEVLRGLKDGEYLTQRPDGTWATTKVIQEIQIPSSIADLIQARVGDLGEEERSLLEIAACAGFEFDAGLVGDVAGLGRIPLLRALGTIEKSHRLIRAAGRRYVFDHHQVQEHLYGGLSEFAREGYHAAIAESLERMNDAASRDPASLDGALCGELCEHFLKGAQGVRALRYLPLAQAYLEKGYLYDAVIRLTERALATPGLLIGVERAKTLLALSVPLEVLGRHTQHEAVAREAELLGATTADDDVRWKAAIVLGNVCMTTARNVEAEASYLQAHEIARAVGNRGAEASAENGLANVFWFSGRPTQAREHYNHALAIHRDLGDRRNEASVTGNLGLVFRSEGRLTEAREHQQRAIEISRETGNRQSEASAVGNLGSVCKLEGRLAEARGHHQRSLEIFREVGNRYGEANATMNLGNIYYSEGRLAEAREHYGRALEIFRETGRRWGEANAAMNLGIVFLSEGQLSDARTYQEQTIATCREIGNLAGEAGATINVGLILKSQGRLGEARAEEERALAICRKIGLREGEAYATQALGAIADEAGDAASALRHADEALSLRRTAGQEAEVAESLLDVGDLRRRSGDHDGARAMLSEGLSLLKAQNRAPHVAFALAMLACLPGGDAGAAVAALAEAGENEYALSTRWLLWQATRDRAHLIEAKRLLDGLLSKNLDRRDSMLANVRINREIAVAAREAGL